MPGQFKTEAVVLRTFRYGEADRILHLYTAERGRVNAIAKGVRRVKSRFGGRLEPLFRVEPRAPRGPRRAVHGHPGRDGGGPRRVARAARRARAGVPGLRRGAGCLLDLAEPNRPAYNLLCRELSAARRRPRRRDARARARVPPEAAAGVGFAPELAACAACGDREHIERLLGQRRRRGLPGLRGRLVPPWRGGARPSWSKALGHPFVETPEAAASAPRQADRAIAETPGAPRARSAEGAVA